MDNYKENYNRYQNTIDFLIYLCRDVGYGIENYIPQELLNNETFYKGIAEYKPSLFEYLRTNWLSEPNNFKKLININPYVYHYCSYISNDLWNNSEIRNEFERITNDYNIMIEKVKNYGYCLEDASYEFRMKNNYEMVLEAVKNDYRFFEEYAPIELQALFTSNKEDILKSFIDYNSDLDQAKSYAVILNNLSDEFKNDSEVIETALNKCGLALKYLLEDNKKNEEYVKIAILQNGLALRYASEELKNNAEIVRIAVSQNGLALRYASEELKNNPEIVKIAVNQDGQALRFASEKLKNNKEIAQLAVEKNSLAIKSVGKELRNNYQINIPIEGFNFYPKTFFGLKNNKIKDLSQLIEFQKDEKFNKMTKSSQKEILIRLEKYKNEMENEEEYKDVTDDINDEISDESLLKENIRLIAKELVKDEGNVTRKYYDLPDNLREDGEVIKEAIKHDLSEIFRNIPKDRDDYYDIVLESVKSVPYLMNDIPEDMKKTIGNDYDTMMTMVKKAGYALGYASEELKNNREIVIEAVKNDEAAISYASKELKNDPEIVLMAVRHNGNALKYIPDHFLKNKEIVIEAAKNGLNFENDSFAFSHIGQIKYKLKELGYLDDPDFKLEMAKNEYNNPRIFIDDPLIIAEAEKLYHKNRIETGKEEDKNVFATEEERIDYIHRKYKEIIKKKIAIDDRRYKEEYLLQLQQENTELKAKLEEIEEMLDNFKKTDKQK
ncbi:MAG: DUF4116 domain-containing protein [Clostridia bacterium]|nr:DUF4116 domain-containing protein [Clostridia bacterium]